ncbi:MAG: hypothetical protein IJV70_04395 [Clostridia bacterium]|nr:hypothetical protein [Clostridia bacterium]
MKNFRFLLLLLCLCMFLPVAACGKDAQRADIPEDKYYYDGSSRERTPDSIPEGYDLENQTIVFWYHNYEYEKDVIGDEETTDIVYSKIFERNLTVQERLNFVLDYSICTASYWPDSSVELQRDIQTMSAAFDAVFAPNNRIIVYKIINYFHNLNDSNYIDIDEPWWYDDAIMELSVDTYNYRFLYGDIQLSDLGRAGTVFFNKNLYAQYLSPTKDGNELYNKVLDGTWTLEELSRLIKKSHISRGGDASNDIYGAILTHAESAHYLREASGIKMYERDETGMPIFNFKDDRSVAFVTALYDLYFNNEGVLNPYCNKTPIEHYFTNSQVIFEMNILYDTFNTSMREMKDDFGILPNPKFNEEQEEYISLVHDASMTTCIPVSTDIDRANEEVSAVIEALASESYRNVIVAFYETALKAAYNRDDQSSQMIDIICGQHPTVKSKLVKNFVYEYNTSLSGIGKIFHSMMVNKNINFVSTYDSLIGPAETGLRDLIQQYVKGTI